MRMTATAALQQRADAKKLGGFSKMWEPGDQGAVIYPFMRDEETGKYDLLVGCIWGHQADPKELGLKTIFIPSLTEMDASGVPVGTPDITYQFSKISKLFIDGMKQAKISKVLAKDIASEASKRSALEEIEKEFDTKNNLKAKKPVVGKAQLLITTECIYIPIKNEVPVPDEARLVTQSLSDERIRKLISIANTTKYAPEEGENYLEVQYAFPAGDKSAAGRTDPVGQVKEYRLKYTHPEQWKAIESLLATLPESSETIAHRNFSYRKFDENQIKNALTTYAILNSEYLDALTNDDDVDRLVRNADVMEQLSIANILTNEELKAKIDAAIEELHKDEEDVLPDEVHEGPAFSNAPTIEEILKNQNKVSNEVLEGVDVDMD